MQTPIREDAPVVCRRLRSKGAPGVTYDDAVSWDAGYVSTAVFWCLGTADVIGPDDGFVHPHVCVRGRACFRDQAPPVADESASFPTRVDEPRHEQVAFNHRTGS